jgi:hypothetical protein
MAWVFCPGIVQVNFFSGKTIVARDVSFLGS